MKFFVYYHFPTRNTKCEYKTIHTEDCRYAQEKKGRWKGPYDTFNEANNTAMRAWGGVLVRFCKVCDPAYWEGHSEEEA